VLAMRALAAQVVSWLWRQGKALLPEAVLWKLRLPNHPTQD
jgi:hypothetical protein